MAAGVTDRRILTRPVLGWAMYDLANTIFSMNIVSLYLSLWVVNEMGGSDGLWAYATSGAMALVFLCAPVLGALSDQAGRRLPFLFVSTVLCVLLTALLGVGSLATTIAIYIGASFFFQAGLIFYDSTLPLVSTPETRGVVGGIGIGLGYLGSFIGVLTGLFLLERIGYVGVFRVTAVLFAVFAAPIFLLVREKRRPERQGSVRVSPTKAVRQVARTLSEVKHHRGLGRFLIGRVFYTDAANTVILFLTLYTVNEVGLTPTTAQIVLLVATVAAVLGAFAFGRFVDRQGPKRALDRALQLWAVALAFAVLIPVLDLPIWMFWPTACLAGIALGGTWTADRPYMLLLAPPDRVGEFYGLYSMVGRFAAIVGPATWGLITDTLGFGRPVAMASLLGWIVIAYWILRGVDDEARVWPEEELTRTGS